jgi:hypothetical protein
MDAATGKDCRFLESALQNNRKICEPKGSRSTSQDYKENNALYDYSGTLQDI